MYAFGKNQKMKNVFANWVLFLFRQVCAKVLPLYFAGTFLYESKKVVFMEISHIHIFAMHIIAFLFVDLCSYILHVWSHRSSIGWLFHKLHHSDDEFNLTTGFRTTVFSGFVNLLAGLPLLMVGFSPQVIIIHIVINNTLQHLTHHNLSFESKINTFLERFMIVSPRFHAKHHESVETSSSYNYGCVLSIWDNIFRTFSIPPNRNRTLKFGVPNYNPSSNPIILTKMYFFDIIKFFTTLDSLRSLNKYDFISLYFVGCLAFVIYL